VKAEFQIAGNDAFRTARTWNVPARASDPPRKTVAAGAPADAAIGPRFVSCDRRTAHHHPFLPMPLNRPKHTGRSLDTISARRRERLRAVLERRQPDLTIVLENIWDPHNVGAILRSADAVGIMTVHLLYYIEQAPDLRTIGKLSSASAKQWLTIRRHGSVEECYAALRDAGFAIHASHLTPSATSLYELDATRPTAFVIGNEHRGVSDTACALADGIFFIPMAGMVQSLNASVANAVILYEAYRQRAAAGLYAQPRLESGQLDQLLADWARK
jgi:tRNA (guanosine-2'-O-)-methyltransferase